MRRKDNHTKGRIIIPGNLEKMDMFEGRTNAKQTTKQRTTLALRGENVRKNNKRFGHDLITVLNCPTSVCSLLSDILISGLSYTVVSIFSPERDQ